MHCARCGSELTPGARFCATCGTAVEAPLLPTWALAAGVLAALVLGGVLVATQVTPDRTEAAGPGDQEQPYLPLGRG